MFLSHFSFQSFMSTRIFSCRADLIHHSRSAKRLVIWVFVHMTSCIFRIPWATKNATGYFNILVLKRFIQKRLYLTPITTTMITHTMKKNTKTYLDNNDLYNLSVT